MVSQAYFRFHLSLFLLTFLVSLLSSFGQGQRANGLAHWNFLWSAKAGGL